MSDLISQSWVVTHTHRFCHENSITFEFKMVDLGKGENKTKEFVDLNPNKTVPVLDDNGFVLYERCHHTSSLVAFISRDFADFFGLPQI
jgi:glutaredoxin